ncbi:hypothetical protein B0H14DRAFT_1567008 [Mycena olivaceomarginata]|nr:hypothetical protein B0H14DRAFT_1567008 [Mycena olivaceomarginata]
MYLIHAPRRSGAQGHIDAWGAHRRRSKRGQSVLPALGKRLRRVYVCLVFGLAIRSTHLTDQHPTPHADLACAPGADRAGCGEGRLDRSCTPGSSPYTLHFVMHPRRAVCFISVCFSFGSRRPVHPPWGCSQNRKGPSAHLRRTTTTARPYRMDDQRADAHPGGVQRGYRSASLGPTACCAFWAALHCRRFKARTNPAHVQPSCTCGARRGEDRTVLDSGISTTAGIRHRLPKRLGVWSFSACPQWSTTAGTAARSALRPPSSSAPGRSYTMTLRRED